MKDQETASGAARTKFMNRFAIALGLLTALALSGCGGSGSFFTQISGVITDFDGNIVRGAKVWANSQETLSNSGGVYVLSGVKTGQRAIHAEYLHNGVKYSGTNVVRVFENERSKNINIAISIESQQAKLRGTVRDRDGFKLAGARVFAYGNALSSQIALTDKDGIYEMDGLAPGFNYTVVASGLGFDSDSVVVNLGVKESRNVDFLLSDPTNPAIPAPANFSAVAWTTPFEQTRSPQDKAALDAVKTLFDPRYKPRDLSRLSTQGNLVEVDLYWDPIPGQFLESLLGFGIYRATTANGASTAIDFLRDPMAWFFSDIDDALLPGRAYYYEATSLNTSYPDTFNSESDFSDRYGVIPLDDLELLPVGLNPLTFRWIAVPGAEEYMVFLFGSYPGFNATALWDTSGSPTAGTSQTYTGPALVPGKRYYYVVLGLANNQDSRTLSIIGDFIAN